MANSSPEWQLSLTFTDRAKYILDNGEWSDCTFLFPTNNHQTVKGHKVILAMASPVFERMFYGPLAENTLPIPIWDIQPQDFKLFLLYIYTGSIGLNCFEDAKNVCYIAKKYMVPELFELCVKRVWELLSPATACHVYEFALLHDNRNLKEKSLKIISRDTLDVIYNPNFETIEVTTLETILDMDDLNIFSEMELYTALCRWACSERSRRAEMGENVSLQDVVKTTLPKLRFLTLTPEEVANGVVGSELLTDSENYSIILNILSQNPIKPLPSGFSTNRTVRNAALRKGNGRMVKDPRTLNSMFRTMTTQENTTTLSPLYKRHDRRF